MIQKLKDFIRKVVFKFIAPPFVPPTFSQAGEDVIVRFLFYDYGVSKIEYLDLGAHAPVYSSNTYLFYREGFRGVCVEADKSLIPAFYKERPEDKILHAGVSVSKDKEADFYIFDIPGINTFDKEEAELRMVSGKFKLVSVDKVPLLSINDIIKDNFSEYPHYLTMDIEGLDLAVLMSLDFQKFPIPVICVETCAYSENHIRPKVRDIIDFMLRNNYEVYADTYINTIFVNKKWFYKEI